MKKGFKVLGLFLLSIIGFISFGNCYYLDINGTNTEYSVGRLSDSSIISGGTCINMVNSSFNPFDIYSSNGVLLKHGSELKNSGITFYCSNIDYFLRNKLNSQYIYHVMEGGFYIDYDNSCPECEICPEVDSGSILSGYIAVSDINMSYCVSNDLCPEMSGGYSALYINDIRHESMPFINITIPEEFNWDYSYTGNNTQFDLNVIGYNTDPDYIAGIINTQNTKPNSTDFNNIVSGLIPLLIPGLVIILFVWFIFKFIKKIF